MPQSRKRKPRRALATITNITSNPVRSSAATTLNPLRNPTTKLPAKNLSVKSPSVKSPVSFRKTVRTVQPVTSQAPRLLRTVSNSSNSTPVEVRRPTIVLGKKATASPVSSRITEIDDDTDSDITDDDSVDPDDLIVEDSEDDTDTQDVSWEDAQEDIHDEHDQGLSRTLIGVSTTITEVSTAVPGVQDMEDNVEDDVEEEVTSTSSEDAIDLLLQSRIAKARVAALKAAELQQQAEAEAEAAERELEKLKEKPRKTPRRKRAVVEVGPEFESDVRDVGVEDLSHENEVVVVEPEDEPEVVVIDLSEEEVVAVDLSEGTEVDPEVEDDVEDEDATFVPNIEVVDLTETTDEEDTSRESHVRQLFPQEILTACEKLRRMPCGKEYVKPWGITDYSAYVKTRAYRNKMISQGCVLDEDNNVIERPENYFGEYSDEWEGSFEQLQLEKKRKAEVENRSRDERAKRRLEGKRRVQEVSEDTQKKKNTQKAKKDTTKDTTKDTRKTARKVTKKKKAKKVKVYLEEMNERTRDVVLDECRTQLFPAIQSKPKKRGRGRPKKVSD